MVFCPFTGIDKYEKCVTFGFALLSKEDIPNFKWAFDEFLKSMGRNPVCIITDQCPAMKQAIPVSFSAKDGNCATKHRLCMWHIMEKISSKVKFSVLVLSFFRKYSFQDTLFSYPLFEFKYLKKYFFAAWEFHLQGDRFYGKNEKIHMVFYNRTR